MKKYCFHYKVRSWTQDGEVVDKLCLNIRRCIKYIKMLERVDGIGYWSSHFIFYSEIGFAE